MAEKEKKEKEKKEKKVDWFLIDGISKTEKEFADWTKKQVTDHPVVKAWHGKWRELLKWEEGEQYTTWNSKTSRISSANLQLRKKKVVINLMKPLVETIEGKLNFFHKIAGIPNSGEQKDIKGAQVATKLIDFNDYTIDHAEIMEEAKYDLTRLGICCKKWTWDTNLNATVAPKADGKVDESKKTKEPGDVQGVVVPIFNVRPDPTAKKQSGIRWMVEPKEVSRDEILRCFGKYKKVTNEILDQIVEDRSSKREGMYFEKDEIDDEAETFIIREFWDFKNHTYKQGRFIVTCADKVFYAGKNPTPGAKRNYFFYFFRKSNYSFWPKGPLFFIQPIQREFNRMISMISEHIESWRPKMAVGQGALKRAESMTVDSFEIVEVDFSRGEPRTINMPELSSQVTAYRDFLIASVDRVSNIHEVSYARLPQYASRAPSSLYAQMLEQESEKLAPMMKRINSTIVKEAQLRLQIMDQHYTMPRMVKILGEARHSMINYYSKVDLNNNFDVRLEIGVSLNQSSAIQQRLYMEMWEKGMLSEEDRLKVLKVMNLGTAEAELRSDIADLERVERENQAIIDGSWDKLPEFENFINGIPISQLPGFGEISAGEAKSKIYKHDDHGVHLEGHTSFVKSEEYDDLPDDSKEKFQRHIEEHFLWLQLLLRSQQGGMPGETAGHPGEAPLGGGGAGGAPGPKPPGPAGGSPMASPGSGL